MKNSCVGSVKIIAKLFFHFLLRASSLRLHKQCKHKTYFDDTNAALVDISKADSSSSEINYAIEGRFHTTYSADRLLNSHLNCDSITQKRIVRRRATKLHTWKAEGNSQCLLLNDFSRLSMYLLCWLQAKRVNKKQVLFWSTRNSFSIISLIWFFVWIFATPLIFQEKVEKISSLILSKLTTRKPPVTTCWIVKRQYSDEKNYYVLFSITNHNAKLKSSCDE